MSVNYRVNDTFAYANVFLKVHIFNNELETILHSDLYSDFRISVNNIVDDVITGKCDDLGVDSYVNFMKLVAKKDKSVLYRYTDIFKYLLMFHLGIVECDIKTSNLSKMLKLTELSKHIKIVPSSIKDMKGGGPGDELTTGREVVPFRPRKNRALLIITIILALLSGFYINKTITDFDKTITDTCSLLSSEHDRVLTQTVTRMLPMYSEDDIQELLELTAVEVPAESGAGSAAGMSTKMLEVPAESGAGSAAGMSTAVVPTDFDFDAYREELLERQKEFNKKQLATLQTRIKTETKSLVEEIGSSLARIDMTPQDTFSMLLGHMPTKYKEGIEHEKRKMQTQLRTIMNIASEVMTDGMYEAAAHSVRLSMGTKELKALWEEEQKEPGYLDTIIGTFSSLTSQFIAPTTVLDAATSVSTGVGREVSTRTSDLTNAMTFFTGEVIHIGTRITQGFFRDITIDMFNMKLATLFTLLTAMFTLIQLFPRSKLVLKIFIPVLGLLFSDNRIMLIFNIGIAAGVFLLPGWLLDYIREGFVTGVWPSIEEYREGYRQIRYGGKRQQLRKNKTRKNKKRKKNKRKHTTHKTKAKRNKRLRSTHKKRRTKGKRSRKARK